MVWGPIVLVVLCLLMLFPAFDRAGAEETSVLAYETPRPGASATPSGIFTPRGRVREEGIFTPRGDDALKDVGNGAVFVLVFMVLVVIAVPLIKSRTRR